MSCILCHQKITRVNTIEHAGKAYWICHCQNCNLQFYQDIAETPVEYYEQLYRDWNVAGVSLRGLTWGHDQCFKLIDWEIKPDGFKMLDVGCAEGLFVQAARQRGIETYGIDINSHLVELAHSNYNGMGRVFCTRLEELKQQPDLPQEYRLATLIDVLEHLHDPKEFVNSVKNYLEPNGYIFVSLPNREVKPRLLPIDGDLPPHHLTWWSRKALYYLFESNGYVIREYFQQRVNPKDFAVWFDHQLTQKLPFLKRAKSSLQESAPRSDSPAETEHRLKYLYQLKKLELDLLTAAFYLPARTLTALGYTGTAHCLLAQRK